MVVYALIDDELHQMPDNGFDKEFKEFILNRDPETFIIKAPNKSTDFWFAHPYFGKSYLSRLAPYLFVDGDEKPVADYGRRIYLCNRLDVDIQYHFFLFNSDDLMCQRFLAESESDRPQAMQRIRLCSLYNLRYYFDTCVKDERDRHFIMFHTNSIVSETSDGIKCENVYTINISKQINKNLLKIYGGISCETR